MIPSYTRALIVGAGEGLSASLARAFANAGMRVALAARGAEKLASLAREIGAATHAVDASQPADVDHLFAAVETALGGVPDVVVYNASARVRGRLLELDRAAVARSLA